MHGCFSRAKQFSADQEAAFIANNLGPAFASNQITTKILGYDHNWDQLGYPTTILNNAASETRTFDVQWDGKKFTYTLPTGAAATFTWSGTQVAGGGNDQIALNRAGWTASTSAPANSCCTADVPANVLDGNVATRWTSAQAQKPGLWLQVTMDRPHSINSLSLDASISYGDYLRNYLVFLSLDGSNWGNPVASGNGTGQVVNISFPAQFAHYIRILDIGSSGSWWSVHELTVYGSQAATPSPLARTHWVASAFSSPSNPCCTGDVPVHAVDGYSTRWSSGQPQSPGQWFQVDMGASQSFSSIALDAATSGGDYPRSYQVFVSNDGTNWGSAIASGNGAGASVVISFAKQSARYVKVVLTSNTGSWWSMHEFYAFA